MSPASSGNLEVKRYIGACLIAQGRSKNSSGNKGSEGFFTREQFTSSDVYQGNYVNLDRRYRIQRCNSVDGWAGGLPLISFANNVARRGTRFDVNDVKSVKDQPSPLARLAVHTQGAPLILTKSFNHRKNKVNRNNNVTSKIFDSEIKHKTINNHQENSNNVDTVSVTSDESSGSANSENCLPRIIKPRKRRKKDRKPPHLTRPINQDGFSTDSASPDIDNTSNSVINLRPLMPFSFDPYRSFPDCSPLGLTFDRHQNYNDISETPNLHHSFEDIEELDDGKDINGNQPTSTCQCRYCDPSGQIWDVDRNCYSPFLTPPTDLKTFQFPSLIFNPTSSSRENQLVHSMSSVSLEDDSEKKYVGPRSSRDLEVSTEIVTSLNGHRDLEIKFFSSSNAESDGISSSDCDKSDMFHNKPKFCGSSERENSKCATTVCKLTSEE